MFASNHSQIPTGIWILGFVSLLMDVSSEMIRKRDADHLLPFLS